MRAALYARVSSVAQRESHTIDGQLIALRSFVTQQRWTLVDTYIDDGRSAKTGKLDKRDGFTRLLVDAAAKRFDVLVTTAMDRLTRTEDLIELASILGPFQRAGIRIFSPSGGEIDLHTTHGTMIAMFQASAAASENARRAERVKSGKARAISEGRKPGGVTPYGLFYSRATGKWAIDHAAAAVVRDIFARVIKGQSCRSIAVSLNDADIKAPRGPWGRHNVWEIVRSRTVRGEWLADKRQRIVLAVPAVIDEDTWQAAQDSLIAHAKRGLVKRKHVYLLDGIATCGTCGAPMRIRSPSPSGRKTAGYMCRGRYGAKTSAEKCDAPILRTADVDARVWAVVAEVLRDPGLAMAAERKSRAIADEARNWKADAVEWNRKLAKLDKHEAALLVRFRRDQISETALDGELAAVARERSVLRAQLATADKATKTAASDVSMIERLTAELHDLAARATPDERRRVVRVLVRQGGAVFVDGKVRLSMRVQLGEQLHSVAATGCKTGHEDSPGHTVRIRAVA